MKKFVIGVCICLCAVTLGLVFGVVFGEQPVELIAIKNGEIKSEYFVGESFDRSDGSIMVKQDGKIFEVPLNSESVKIKDFNTSRPVQNAIAIIEYGRKTVSFTYSVKLRPSLLLSVNDSIVTYDGGSHDIEYSAAQGTTVTKQLVQHGIGGTTYSNFTGATHAGTYTILVTASRFGYSDNQQYATLIIKPREVYAQLNAPVDNVYNGSGKPVTISNKDGVLSGDECNLIIATTFQTEAEPIVVETGKNAGTYRSYFKGVSNSDYILSPSCPTQQNPFEWEIVKANYVKGGGGALTAEDVGFANKTVAEAGTKQTIICEGEVLVDGVPISPSYEYRRENEEGIISGDGVTEVGVYEVTAIYRFANFNDVRFTATLTITEAADE